MSGESFRFLHAADFHLEQSLRGLSDVPEHLREILRDAPLSSAERVFETALLEQVDFVVLSGDVLDYEQAGPRAVAFLIEQFRRLDERGIPVYWAGGAVDSPQHWPKLAQLPSCVHRFVQDDVEEVSHFRRDRPLATIMGLSAQGKRRVPVDKFASVRGEQFTIAATYGSFPGKESLLDNIDYWALGGLHQRRTLATEPAVIHYPGATQGCCPTETGKHGCTLVNVGEDGRASTQFIAADSLRWHRQQVKIERELTAKQLEDLMSDRLERLMQEAGGVPLLVSWYIDGEDEAKIDSPICHSTLAEELSNALRTKYGSGSRPGWTVAVDIEAPEEHEAEWYTEDTILGDYLRAVRETEESERPLDVTAFLDEAHSELEELVQIDGAEQRQNVLRKAALLGVELLRGEKISETPR